MNLSLIVILFILVACGKGEHKFVKVTEKNFSQIVNQKKLTTEPNLSVDKSIINTEYPIEIALYEDHKFYYDLPNLGDGTGTWSYEDGHLTLIAARDIFDMKIDVHSMDEMAQEISIRFIDRFGPNVLKMRKTNQ